MSTATLSFPNTKNTFLNQLLNTIERFRSSMKPQLREIRVPAFRLEEFKEELSSVGGKILGEKCSFVSGIPGIPVIIDCEFNPLYVNNLVLLYWADGHIARIESKLPPFTIEDISKAVQEMRLSKWQTSKTQVLPSSAV